MRPAARLRTAMVPALLAFALVCGQAVAGPIYNVSVVGAGLRILSPSADTFTFNDATGSGPAGRFGFQTGHYFVGDSGQLQETDIFSATENVTINGQTLAVTINYQNAVSNPANGNLDVLTVLGSEETFFRAAGVSLTVLSAQTGGHDVSGIEDIQINALLADIPEPASIALLGAGLVGLGMMRRKRVW